MQFSRFLLVFCLALVWGVSDFATAQSMGAPPPPAKDDKEKKKPKKDPVLTGAFAPIPMDWQTQRLLAFAHRYRRVNPPGENTHLLACLACWWYGIFYRAHYNASTIIKKGDYKFINPLLSSSSSDKSWTS